MTTGSPQPQASAAPPQGGAPLMQNQYVAGVPVMEAPGAVPYQAAPQVYAAPPAYVVQNINVVPLGTEQDHWMMCGLTFFCNIVGCLVAMLCMESLQGKLGAVHGCMALMGIIVVIFLVLLVMCLSYSSYTGGCIIFWGLAMATPAIILGVTCCLRPGWKRAVDTAAGNAPPVVVVQ